MARTKLNRSHDEIKAMEKEYNKKYYLKHKEKILETTRTPVINNAISRLQKSDKYIKMFISSIGIDKINELIEEIQQTII
jgi:hypothetical protein